MVVLSQNDFLEVKLSSLLADYDRETLVNLYQPIIGYRAMSVYFTLWSEANNEKITTISTHGQIFNRMQINPGDFIDARKLLEAVGLIKTFLQKDPNVKFYHYELYAPKTPKSFFEDTLLFGMLIKTIGETDANKLKNIYHLEKNDDNGQDVSASFVEVFQPNFDDPAFIKALESSPTSFGRQHGHIVSAFSYENFFNELKKISLISEDGFTKKDMKEIERLATLNGINDADVAGAVASIYDGDMPKGKHVDFNRLANMLSEDASYYQNHLQPSSEKSYVSSNNQLATKINMMEKVTPKAFLSALQNGIEPAPSDLKLINLLSSKYHLSNGVINALLDFCLQQNNNILSKPYCEKVAASLTREMVQTTIDAMNYLRKASKSQHESRNSKKYISNVSIETSTPAIEKNTSSSTNELGDEEDWSKMLDELDNDEGGK